MTDSEVVIRLWIGNVWNRTRRWKKSIKLDDYGHEVRDLVTYIYVYLNVRALSDCEWKLSREVFRVARWIIARDTTTISISIHQRFIFIMDRSLFVVSTR